MRILVSNDNHHLVQETAQPMEDRREYGYRRMIIDRIEYLFRGQLIAGSTAFSRRLIPGLLMDLELIRGPNARARFDVEADRLDKMLRSDPERAAACVKAMQT